MTTLQADIDHSAIADNLVTYSRLCYQRGWMPGTSGNLSVRAGDQAFITASGRSKGELTHADVIEIRAESGAVTQERQVRPSAETCIHTVIYRTTQAAAVIHVHSPYATAVAHRLGHGTDLVILPVTGFELLKGLGLADPSRTEVPIFPNWAEVPRIAAEVQQHLSTCSSAPPGLLIADHGITVWGHDLAEARNRLECLESIFQILCITHRNTSAHPSVEKEAMS